ncbi:Rieske (2Fe-2S) domain-containing protein [Pseudomonas sp. 9AZ]|uniref:aromatic ring-hydroxylating oxygenase subunit alpha n=1 Tax=Pseudomonas sp. 9AZ TaxID=2653168 RepID=UPI0012F09A98|nr:aromatic ring-hydroxylating dioxygenase subunit alpha [Pseudomonas sp. 9AZ]VXD04394.1 Rieske (2Fe-2S) domain-containing protein [Pseudomonas sp. 9AZ]
MSSREKAKEPTIGKWLASDRRTASELFARRSDGDFGTDDLPVERYISRDFHEREVGKLWSKVWQMACHETDIPEVGDYITYEIGSRSFVITHAAEGVIKAFPNACLHRGMQLVDDQGQAPAFTCRFHGWSWNLDGTMRRMPESWDFPQAEQRKMCLKAVRVATWGGFVFINPDADAQPFEEFIGELPEHFKAAPLEDRRIAVHVARFMPANWKVAMEAFLESYHVSPTHPQSVTVSEYAETQYDVYGENLSRLATVAVAPATPAMRQMTPQEFADYAAKGTGREPIQLGEGETYRSALAEQRRKDVAAVQGTSVDHLTDVEMLDAIEYFLFPNFLPWYGFGLPIVYRFRPNGDRHDSSIMEIYLLAPRDLSKPPPPAAKIEWLPDDRPFAEHPGLGRLGTIFDQDYENIVGVWKGLHSTVEKGLILGQYQESRIRHYHRRIDDFINAQEK